MDERKEPVRLRNNRLFQTVLTKNCPMQKRSGSLKISHDALIDSFLVIFDECSKDGLKKDITVSYFVNKYKSLVADIRSLRVSLSDFDLKNVVGKGFFGEVRVVQEKVTGDVFAMKVINKAKTLKNASAALFEEERDILSTATSPWLTSLQYAFQDPYNLYLVMEYLPGGDLMSLLDREGGRLSVDQARFYLAETLLALHDLHRLGYVHRDVKPDNVLLDRLGHVKLADFGSAARLSADGRVLTAMPAGTPDYIAPEVLQVLEPEKGKKTSYGIECDFWSLGVLAYALVLGSSPFSGSRTSVTYSKILTHQPAIPYPDSVSVTDSLKDLINNLLRPAKSRLDYLGARKHLFFLEVDFSSLRTVMPPVVPVVTRPDDTSNFTKHERKPSEPCLTPRDSQKDFSGKQLPFIGFTYSGVSDEPEESKKADTTSKQADERQQQSLDSVRRENKELLSKLLAAQQANRSSDSCAERAEQERATLNKELIKERQTSASLRKCIEEERADRRQTEQKALLLARQGQQAQERAQKAFLTEWQAKVDELTDCLTEAHTINNELASRCDRAEDEVRALRLQVDKFNDLELSYKEKLAKAQEFRRRSVTDFQTRLDRIQHHEDKLQGKLSAEAADRQAILHDLHALQAKASKAEAKWRDERAQLEQDLRDTRVSLKAAEAQSMSAQVQLSDTSALDACKARLAQAQTETAMLRSKVTALETELSNTNQSFLEHETVGQRELVQDLEKELRAVTEEKSQLQSLLQGLQDQDKDDKRRLLELERILETLEREVGKLEKENAQLKQQAPLDPDTAKLSSHTEVQYQQKVIVLEEQIAKLEGQIERLRETAILEKQELRQASTKLRKTEKELSDAKLDVRIANREVKTAEEQVTKLQDELKTTRDRQKKMQEAKEAEVAQNAETIDSLRAELKALEAQCAELKKVRAEAARLGDAEKALQCEYNSLRQQYSASERQLAAARAQVEALQLTVQTLTNERTSLSGQVEELRTRVGGLELNNTVLKETGKMLEEQVEDYDKFVSDQTASMQALKQSNGCLSQQLARLETDLAGLRVALSEEKALRSKVETQSAGLRVELADKVEVVEVLRSQLEMANCSEDSLSARVIEKERLIRDLEQELYGKEQGMRELQAEVQWLKEEITARLSDMYLFKEETCRLNLELEEGARFADVLQDRIRELEQVITELESFHRQRELKDDATKQQQNKLICFLQTKLQEDKKKKTFADKLFGPRRRPADPPSPQTPMHKSPRHSPRTASAPASSTSDALRKQAMASPRGSKDSPMTQQALSQLVNSPTNRMQRQMSLPRMHHKIPHRFKIQASTALGKCASCFSNVARGSKASVCLHCPAIAHPNCAVTAPKTCGLPAGYAQHFAQTVKSEPAAVAPDNVEPDAQGWVDLMMPGESSWGRRYLKVEGSTVLIYNTEPSRADGPARRWDLLHPHGQALVSDHVTAEDLPGVAKHDLPFVIKVVSIPRTTCWPAETHYLLIRNSADKTKWITALQSAVAACEPPNDTNNNLTVLCQDSADMGIQCVAPLSDGLALLGAENGLFALQGSGPSAVLVRIQGVPQVHVLTAAPHVNRLLMVAGEQRCLVSADYRLVVSNASAAACSNPSVQADVVDLGNEGAVTRVCVSEETDGVVYLAAATNKQINLLRWCNMSSRFTLLCCLPTSQPVTCLLFHLHSVIVGSETFQQLSCNDFSVQEVLRRPGMRQSLVRLRSYPQYVVRVGTRELLLCFREFGLFVDDRGHKTRPDLKWALAPRDFAHCAPFLYVIGPSSVEIVRIPATAEPASAPADDADGLSIASTATLNDTTSVALDNPQLLGVSERGVIVRSGGDVVLVEGSRLSSHGAHSSSTLNRVASEGQFSFTSSIVGSLDGSESDESPQPHNRIQHTEL